MQYAKVIIDQKNRRVDRLFTYRAPSGVRAGSVVKVPFGKGKTLKRGFVLATEETTDVPEEKLKSIASVDEYLSLNEEMLATAGFMTGRYAIRHSDALRLFLPPGKPPHAKQSTDQNRAKTDAAFFSVPPPLTEEQELAMERIGAAIEEERRANFLIHGVTGSGKTELYMRATEKVIAQGKSVIILLPEIALTRQITDRFVARFGEETIAILHSRLTVRKRFDTWMRIRRGEARIVIGARMAVFAPLTDIGLIVMDEEHEATYKSDQTPKYETVDIAYKRLNASHGILLLGSATPSVVSYYRAKQGIYELIRLRKRYNGVLLPHIFLADRKEDLRSGNSGIFGELLLEKLKETLVKGQQAILFLNRRGYSTAVTCNTCGFTMTCPDCGIRLTYHKKENAGVCHYCGKRFAVPKDCPDCGSPYIRYRGVGTEQVEEAIQKIFPDTVIARLDLDTAKSEKAIQKILKDFASGKTDILVGTQLVAKGLDFRHVGMVGVVSADTTLYVPDYRSTERTYQLITQVAGRCGRGEEEGTVVVQTFDPENFAIRAAAQGGDVEGYEAFYEKEIAFRRMMAYPPFTDLILIEFVAEKEADCKDAADRFYTRLRAHPQRKTDVLYPPKVEDRPAAFAGEGTSTRYYILIKAGRGMRRHYMRFISVAIGEEAETHPAVSIITDVNPYGSF